MKVLDFGCWDKKMDADLYVGVGIDPEGRCQADVVHEIDINKMGSLPYNDGYFDVILMQGIIEHLTNIYPMISESRRLLKPDGTIILNAPNCLSYDNRLMMLFGKNKAYPCPYKNMLAHHLYFDVSALNEFVKRFYQDFNITKTTYRCYGRYATLFRNFMKLRPTLFATETKLEIRRKT